MADGIKVYDTGLDPDDRDWMALMRKRSRDEVRGAAKAAGEAWAQKAFDATEHPRAAAGSTGGGEFVAGPHNFRVQDYEMGRRPEPELFHGLSAHGLGTIQVHRRASGKYDVAHAINKQLVPHATNAEAVLARDMAQRLYGYNLAASTGDLIKQHSKLVERALKRGYPVPDAVLNDYPQLRRKYSKVEKQGGDDGKPENSEL